MMLHTMEFHKLGWPKSVKILQGTVYTAAHRQGAFYSPWVPNIIKFNIIDITHIDILILSLHAIAIF